MHDNTTLEERTLSNKILDYTLVCCIKRRNESQYACLHTFGRVRVSFLLWEYHLTFFASVCFGCLSSAFFVSSGASSYLKQTKT